MSYRTVRAIRGGCNARLHSEKDQGKYQSPLELQQALAWPFYTTYVVDATQVWYQFASASQRLSRFRVSSVSNSGLPACCAAARTVNSAGMDCCQCLPVGKAKHPDDASGIGNRWEEPFHQRLLWIQNIACFVTCSWNRHPTAQMLFGRQVLPRAQDTRGNIEGFLGSARGPCEASRSQAGRAGSLISAGRRLYHSSTWASSLNPVDVLLIHRVDLSYPHACPKA